MFKYSHMLALIVCSHSITGFAMDRVVYGYDNSKHEIYVESVHQRKTFKFEEDYTGNPSYSFDYFSGAPAIIGVGRALHDSTVYATLDHNKQGFYIDCLYSNIKSKQNGVSVKEGACGLNMLYPERYIEYIEGKVNEIIEDIDATDTYLILSGRITYLPIIIFRSKEKTIYKLYNSKKSLLNDEYSIVSIRNDGYCDVYTDNPWVIYNHVKSDQVNIMSEKITNGKFELTNATPKVEKADQCILYPLISIKEKKSFFYDNSFNLMKSYLIKDDKVNLLSMKNNGKWCTVNYINNKNKSFKGQMLCSNLKL